MDQAPAQGTDDGNGVVADDFESSRLSLAFSTWHRLLRTLLVVHVPLLALFAYFREIDTVLWVALLTVPLLLVVASSSVGSERFRASLIAIGFSWCSWLLIVWSGGAIEAHFHALITIGLVGLYRDWVALAITTVAQIVLHLVIAPIDPSLIYNHEAAIESPLTWGFVQVCAVLGAAAVPIFSWRGTRQAEDHSAERATEVVREAAEGQRQRAVASVYATVARRSQTLLERQLDLIEKLEQDEKDPDALQDLFSLDHLATRMNREAASMLVLAGGEPNRRVVGRPPMSEVARGAIGEIEDYTRVDLELTDDRTVEGRVVAPLVHLLSELVENAASYSPPDSRVRLVGSSTADGSFVLRIIDRGIGIDPQKLVQYNYLLTNPRSTNLTDSQRLGLDVVARLAGRYSLPVQLSANPEGRGTVATVLVPSSLLSAPEDRVLANAPPATEMPMPSAPDDLLEEPRSDGKSEAPLPPMEPTPPVPVPAAAASSSAPQGVPAGAPAWAQATARATSGEPQKASAASATTSARQGAAEPAQSGPAATPDSTPDSAPGSGASWSYSGHLTGEVSAAPPPPKKKRRGRFGRKSGAPVAGAGPVSEVPEDASAGPVPDDADNPIQAPDDLDALLNATRIGARTAPSGAAPSQPETPAAPAPAAEAPVTPAGPAPSQAPAADAPEEDPAITSAQAAAAAMLDDLPGMGGAGSPAPAQPRPAASQPGPGQPPGRPAVGMPSSARDASGAPQRPTVGSASPQPSAPQPSAPQAPAPQAPGPQAPGPQPAAAPQPGPAAQLPTRQPVASAEQAAPAPAPTVSGGDVRPAAVDGPAPPADERPKSSSGERPTSEIGTPLPKRRRGAALPPTLRTPADGPKPAAAAAAPVSREQSRNLLSSYQSRLQAGRKAAEEQVSNQDGTPPDDADGPGEES